MNRSPYNRQMPGLYDQPVSDLLGLQSWERRNGLFVPARDTDLVLSDVTINNATTGRHGFLKKLSGSASEYMDGSGNWSTPATSSADADIRLGKTFFTTNSLMPATTYKEELYTMPVPDYSNLNSGTLSRTLGRIRYTSSGTNVHNFGWDLGGLKTKVLWILCGIKLRNFGFQLSMSDSAPGVGEPPNGTYYLNMDVGASQLNILKRSGGAFTGLTSDSTWFAVDAYNSHPIDFAFYYDDSTGELKGFLRVGMESWVLVCSVTDSSFTTMRYIGVRLQSSGSLVYWMSVPMAIYYTT